MKVLMAHLMTLASFRLHQNSRRKPGHWCGLPDRRADLAGDRPSCASGGDQGVPLLHAGPSDGHDPERVARQGEEPESPEFAPVPLFLAR
jgi:hypothetical protein